MAQSEAGARDGRDREGVEAREALLEQLIFECLERIESEGPQVLEELCRAQPALAAELLERIHALVQRGLVDVGAGAELGDDSAPSAAPPLAAPTIPPLFSPLFQPPGAAKPSPDAPPTQVS